MNKLLMAFLLGSMSFLANAGCAEQEDAQCAYYLKGELKSQSRCQVTTCAAVTYFFSTWTWQNGNQIEFRMDPDTQELTLNGKPYYPFPLKLSEPQSCFVIEGTDEMVCTNSDAF